MANITRNRIRSLRATLLTSIAHHYPYTDKAEAAALRNMGLLDSTDRITLAGAMVVLSDAASGQIPWLAVEETQRILNEIKIVFGDQLNLKG